MRMTCSEASQGITPLTSHNSEDKSHMLLAFSLLFQKKYISVALLSISFLEFILAHSTIRNYIFNQGKALIATCIYSICNTLWGAFPLEKKPCH